MVNDQIQPSGELQVTLTKADGSIKEEHTFSNIVVTTGKEFIASRMIDDSVPMMAEMGIGDSNATLDVGNTTLVNQLTRKPLVNSTVASNVVTYVGEFLDGVGTGGIVEAGIFSGGTPDTMLCRTTFPVINKETDDILTINWNVTIN